MIAYVVCRYDGYLEHVGMLLAERYNNMEKVLELLRGGDIVSLREDLELIERERPMNYEQLEEYKVKVANGAGDYLLNVEGHYKYLFKRGRWYVVDGLCENDCVTPLRRPLPLAKAV